MVLFGHTPVPRRRGSYGITLLQVLLQITARIGNQFVSMESDYCSITPSTQHLPVSTHLLDGPPAYIYQRQSVAAAHRERLFLYFA